MADKADKAQEQVDANDAAAAKKREADKSAEEARRLDNINSYRQLVAEVEDLKVMCDTRAFQKFVKACRRSIEDAKTSLLTAKPAEVIALQAKAMVTYDLLSEFKNSVDELNKFIEEMPLFSDEFDVRAQWSQELMRVELRKK